MRIALRLVLDCPPDAAWRLIRSPQSLSDVSAPLMTVSSKERGGFPPLWTGGPHLVTMLAFGALPAGDQVIDISFRTRGDTRIMTDAGIPLTGPLSVVTRWKHELAVSPAPGGRTLYRDRLDFSAGALSVLLWPALWAFWQWRGIGLRRFARGLA